MTDFEKERRKARIALGRRFGRHIVKSGGDGPPDAYMQCDWLDDPLPVVLKCRRNALENLRIHGSVMIKARTVREAMDPFGWALVAVWDIREQKLITWVMGRTRTERRDKDGSRTQRFVINRGVPEMTRFTPDWVDVELQWMKTRKSQDNSALVLRHMMLLPESAASIEGATHDTAG